MILPEKIINVGRLKHAITKINLVAPEFGNGAVEFAYSIRYLALPSFLGGNANLGKKYLQSSVTKGKEKYFYEVTGDLENARKDVLRVASQKPEDYKDFYPSRIHFITDGQLQFESL